MSVSGTDEVISANVDIHPSAVVHPKAQLGVGVRIGPYSVIGPDVKLGDRTRCQAHVCIDGVTTIGSDCDIFPFASLGTIPQDLKYQQEASSLVIGDRNRIREHVTMNTGTSGGGNVTTVGNDGLFMVGCHVAHDCRVADRVVMANNATLAGHVIVGSRAIIGGLAAVHQFVRIGESAMIGGGSIVIKDVIPYALVSGDRATLSGLNLVGMKRADFSTGEIKALRHAFKSIFQRNRSITMLQAVLKLEQAGNLDPLVLKVLSFIKNDSSRGLMGI
jgi:UDP-N-acetylglucosamine acyltransferase